MTEKTAYQTVAAQIPARPLNNAELAATAGGRPGPKVNKTCTIYVSGMVECGTLNKSTRVITYRPCPRCNKPMHTEWYVVKWYCDPCDFSEYRPREEVWNGTEESLIAAAK